jgi:GST-like protein
VLDKRLTGRDYVCGDYSIADMACWPWLLYSRQRPRSGHYAHVARWFRPGGIATGRQRVAHVVERPADRTAMPRPRGARSLFGWKD